MLCANIPSVPVLALTATASKSDVAQIKESLNLKNPLEVIAKKEINVAGESLIV